MPKVSGLMLIPGMSDVAAMMLGMLVFGLILRGGWWLMNWKVSHPRSIHTGTGIGPLSSAFRNADGKADLPAVFRMSAAIQVVLCVLLLSPPVVATILIRDEWEDWGSFLMELLVNLLNPSILFLTCIIYLLCPFTAWNIYWRRKDFIKFDINQVEYRSAYKTGKLEPGTIKMFRSRSWRFDLTDLFRGQMASSWFLEIIQFTGHGQDGANREQEHVILDLKAMNLGGQARAIAALVSQVYGDKFLINNELPTQTG